MSVVCTGCPSGGSGKRGDCHVCGGAAWLCLGPVASRLDSGRQQSVPALEMRRGRCENDDYIPGLVRVSPLDTERGERPSSSALWLCYKKENAQAGVGNANAHESSHRCQRLVRLGMDCVAALRTWLGFSQHRVRQPKWWHHRAQSPRLLHVRRTDNRKPCS